MRSWLDTTGSCAPARPTRTAPSSSCAPPRPGTCCSPGCGASIWMRGVLPHDRILPVGRLSFWHRLSLFNSMVEGCGGGQRRPRSGALSTVAAGAPQAHRPHVHSLPGAKRPAPAGRELFLPRLFHTSAGMTVGLRSLPRIISFARSARQPLTRRCNVRSCALPA